MPEPVAAVLSPVRHGRWYVLTAFGLLVACTQVLWLSFAPITTQAHQVLEVSEGAIGDLAVINPIMYVVLAIPTGRWLDRRFGSALVAGALFTAAGAVIRTIGPFSYAWLFAGQLVLSIGQPLVLNASTKIAARYFPPDERTGAISIASAAQFVGILVAAMTSPALLDAGGLRLVILTDAAITVAAAAAVIAALRVPPSFATDATARVPLGWLRHDRLMWRLAGLLFIGVGLFNAVATWLDTILGDLGHPGTGGTLIAVMTVAGIAGAAVLPNVAARRDRRRELLAVTIVVTVLVFLGMALVHSVLFAGIALALEGFFLLAGLPVALDWSELDSGPVRAGTATGFLLLAGNLGGAVLVLLVQLAIGNPYLALVTMSVMAVPGVALAAGLPDHVRSHRDDDLPRSGHPVG